jgi:uncharacterized protein YggE
MRTIRITGRGQIRVKPDTTRITMTLTGLFAEYAETLRRSSEDTEALKDLLSGFGFERSDLKTLRFGVDPEYESYRDKKGDYKQRFAGCRYNHSMKVEFASDNDRLGKILYALAHCPIRPEFRISYTVKDPEKAKNELLGLAVADARAKATVLTMAAGTELLSIQSIDYSRNEPAFEVRPMNRLMAAKGAMVEEASMDAGYNLDIEPDDIEVFDTVTIVWEIA